MRGHITSRCHREQLLACFLLAAHVPRSGAGPGKGFGTSEAGGLAPPASPGRPAQGAEAVPSPSLSTGILSTGGTSYRFGELVRCRSLGRLRGGSLAPPGSYLGCDCRHTQGNRGRAGGARRHRRLRGAGGPGRGPGRCCPSPSCGPIADFGAAPSSKRCREEGPGRAS